MVVKWGFSKLLGGGNIVRVLIGDVILSMWVSWNDGCCVFCEIVDRGVLCDFVIECVCGGWYLGNCGDDVNLVNLGNVIWVDDGLCGRS